MKKLIFFAALVLVMQMHGMEMETEQCNKRPAESVLHHDAKRMCSIIEMLTPEIDMKDPEVCMRRSASTCKVPPLSEIVIARARAITENQNPTCDQEDLVYYHAMGINTYLVKQLTWPEKCD